MFYCYRDDHDWKKKLKLPPKDDRVKTSVSDVPVRFWRWCDLLHVSAIADGSLSSLDHVKDNGDVLL